MTPHHEEVVAFVDRLGLVLDASRPEGRGPTATAIREGRCMLSNEIGEDSPMAFWRPAAEHFGIGSAACFPLRCAGHTVAGISLYAPVPGYFRDDLLHLLEQLAEDLSHALDRFESTVQRQRAELELRRAAELLEAKPEIAPPARPERLPEPARGSLSFRNVTFRYPARPEAAALRDFTLEIEPAATLRMDLPRWSAFHLPMPLWLAPRIAASRS